MKIFFQGQLLSVGIPFPSGSYVLEILKSKNFRIPLQIFSRNLLPSDSYVLEMEETDIFRCIHRKIPSSHNHGGYRNLVPFHLLCSQICLNSEFQRKKSKNFYGQLLSVGICSFLVAMYLKKAKIPNSEVFLQKKSSHMATPKIGTNQIKNRHESNHALIAIITYS